MDVCIVGGGAAGLMTAIVAVREGSGLRVAVLEGATKPGAKILVSGGGRCNVTNRVVLPSDFHGDRALIARVLRRFGTDDTVRFFEGLGVSLKHEPEFDKLFPVTDSARTVLDALLGECARLGVDVTLGSRVERVAREGEGFVVEGSGRRVTCRRLVLATGGRSLPRSGSDGVGYAFAQALGHTVTDTAPALVPLLLSPHPLAGLDGIAFPATIEAWIAGRLAARVSGPVLVTHFGISGPAALDVSRHWSTARLRGETAEIRLSFLPGVDAASAESAWVAAAARAGTRVVATLLDHLPARLARRVLDLAQVPPGTRLASLSRDARRRLAATATSLALPVTDTRGWNVAEVTAGGVPLPEVDVRTMESRRTPGLHLVGEILDVEGRLGGFNFQWAWSTGFVAGQALASASRASARRGGTNGDVPR